MRSIASDTENVFRNDANIFELFLPLICTRFYFVVFFSSLLPIHSLPEPVVACAHSLYSPLYQHKQLSSYSSGCSCSFAPVVASIRLSFASPFAVLAALVSARYCSSRLRTIMQHSFSVAFTAPHKSVRQSSTTML